MSAAASEVPMAPRMLRCLHAEAAHNGGTLACGSGFTNSHGSSAAPVLVVLHCCCMHMGLQAGQRLCLQRGWWLHRHGGSSGSTRECNLLLFFCPCPLSPTACGPCSRRPTAPACRSTAARFPGVQFRGRNSSFYCGTADNYEECYRECGCWRTRNQCSPPPPPSPADAPPSPPPAPAAPCGNAPEVACNYVVFSPNDTRCAADGSQNMCVYLSTVTGADAAPALQSGMYGNVDSLSLDGEQRLPDPEP